MNLASLVEECERRSAFNDPLFRPYWKTYLNAALREFARVQPWPGLEDIFTLNSAGSDYLVLPNFVSDVVSIFNKTDNRPVECLGNWDRDIPSAYGQRLTGAVKQYAKLGEVPAVRDPVSYLNFASAHASDIDQVFITGRFTATAASGTALESYIKTVSAYATGTTPVTISTLFSKLISISKTTLSNGDYLFFDSGAAPISILQSYEQDACFRRIQLMFTPASTVNFEIRFRYKLPPLLDNSQSPHPSVKPDFLISNALEQFYRHHDQFQKAQVMQSLASDVLQKESNKEVNFSEDYSQITPLLEDDPDE